MLALLFGLELGLALFCEPPVAVFAYRAGKHVVCQFNPLGPVLIF